MGITTTDLGHDGLVLWPQFKEFATARNWRLENMSPAELEEYYDLFKAGYDAARANTSDRWVAVEKRLPEESGVYLVTARNRYDPHGLVVMIATFNFRCDRRFGTTFDNVPHESITAWQPLPEPFQQDTPQEGGENAS